MEINLILFDKVQESIMGTFRGLILIVLFFIVDLSINNKKIKTYDYQDYLLKFLLFLFISSALAINQAKSVQEAVIWGFGIGSTIFGCIIFSRMLSNKDNKMLLNIKDNIIYYILGVVQCIVFSLLMYFIFFKNKTK